MSGDVETELNNDRSDGIAIVPCPLCGNRTTIGGLPLTLMLCFLSRCSTCGVTGPSPLGECLECGIVVHMDKDQKLYHHKGVTYRLGTELAPWKPAVDVCQPCKEQRHDDCSGIVDKVANGIRVSTKCGCDCARSETFTDVVLSSEKDDGD